MDVQLRASGSGSLRLITTRVERRRHGHSDVSSTRGNEEIGRRDVGWRVGAGFNETEEEACVETDTGWGGNKLLSNKKCMDSSILNIYLPFFFFLIWGKSVCSALHRDPYSPIGALGWLRVLHAL